MSNYKQNCIQLQALDIIGEGLLSAIWTCILYFSNISNLPSIHAILNHLSVDLNAYNRYWMLYNRSVIDLYHTVFDLDVLNVSIIHIVCGVYSGYNPVIPTDLSSIFIHMPTTPYILTIPRRVGVQITWFRTYNPPTCHGESYMMKQHTSGWCCHCFVWLVAIPLCQLNLILGFRFIKGCYVC